jgi:hypothetical protein
VRARLVASAVAVAALAITLAGCNFITPQASLYPYDASDGVSTAIGDVHVLNALVLTDDGTDGNLVFTALNDSGSPVNLTVQFSSGGQKTDLDLALAPRSRNDFGFGAGGQLFLAGMDTAAGSLLPVYFQYGDVEGKQLMVPVLDGSLPQYQPYLPTPTPTPTETGLPTPNPTETPGS